MTTNIESLLSPISDPAPCGVDMAFSPEFDAIAQMRRADDASLAQGEWVTTLKTADWPGVVDACTQLLQTRTKDLRVAGWLADARAQVDGFAGLASGLDLIAALLDRYWDSIHPMAEDGDVEQRIGNLTWILARVEALAPQLPIGGRGAARFGVAAVDAARSRPPDASASGGEPSKAPASPNLDEMVRALSAAGPESHQAIAQSVSGAREALGRLETATDARLGAEGPGFSAARNALDHVLAVLRRLGRDAGVEGASTTAETGAAGEDVAATDGSATTAAASPQAAPQASGPPQSRAQALAQLREVAAYFRRTEPHSPVAYLADRAARWGEMPLHDWLRTVIKDEGNLAQLEELLGVERPRGDDQG